MVVGSSIALITGVYWTCRPCKQMWKGFSAHVESWSLDIVKEWSNPLKCICLFVKLLKDRPSWTLKIKIFSLNWINTKLVISLAVPSVLWRCWLGGRKGIQPVKKSGDGGGGHWLVRMEWRPAGWSVCLPLLIFPCTMKSRSSVLAPAHPGGCSKRAIKWLWWCGVVVICLT